MESHRSVVTHTQEWMVHSFDILQLSSLSVLEGQIESNVADVGREGQQEDLSLDYMLRSQGCCLFFSMCF